MASIRLPSRLDPPFTAWLVIDASTQQSMDHGLPTKFHHYMTAIPVLFENGMTEIMLVVPRAFGDSLVWRACVSMLGLDLARRLRDALEAGNASSITLTTTDEARAWRAILDDVEASKG